MTNPFLAIADAQQNAASKARDRANEKRLAKLVVKSEAEAPMVASPADKRMFENSQLLKQYRQHLADRERDLLEGPHGREVKALIGLLNALTLSSAAALVAYILKANWLRTADYNTRHDVLALVGTAISRTRVRNGLPPFDDSLWDEPPTAFEQIRKILTGVGVRVPA